ncbi:ABC transporter permease [Persicitalea jodogahamensis]|uniref:ABC transporter permease n=1 Tax=Persicitalea jodogahamensis TaxID=402147 RepID=A0A8J3G818_9BACT|nr:ABC transporter permease [Persicitalea jodogahamensis]GHB54859.1 ABC transporter permease [Persicitalea jodogahamensis]
MLRNYLKIAYRSLLKNKLFSGINIFGLALGMACALLIGLWVRYELSYDRFIPGVENIYNVQVNYAFNGGKLETAQYVPGPLQEAIAKDIPNVAAVTKISGGGESLVKSIATATEKSAKEKGHFVSAEFFDVFSFPVFQGDAKAALAQLDKIIITRKLAEKYFPNKSALGQTLQLDDNKLYTVGAVLDDLPANSTLQFDWLANLKNIEQPYMTEWTWNSVIVYARLLPTASPDHTQASMKDIFRRYATFDNGEVPVLHPMTAMHLYSDYKDGKVAGGRIEYVRIFSLVALFILLIACINFMNLATARSSVRAREVGVRKVVGARRMSLVAQFLGESLLMSLLAAGLAIFLVWSTLPSFNALFDNQLSLDLDNPMFWALVGALILITGLLSGSYPALFLSAMRPLSILKGFTKMGTGPALFRRTLVVFQFSLSIFLIVGMLVIGSQMRYLRTKNLGLDRENVVFIPLEGAFEQAPKSTLFREKILRQPTIASATLTSQLPVNVRNSTTDLAWPGKEPKRMVEVSTMNVGGDFIRTMNIDLAAGRDFQPNNAADSSNYLINETAAKLMGMSDPVGQEVTFNRGKGRVVGLMKDFHLNSMHQAIAPLVLAFYPENTRYLLVKIRAGQTPSALAALERINKELNPNYPFSYQFVDEAYEKLYQSEQQVSTLVNYFGVLAILISCLGLFGLVAFTAEQRTKEIGIRKVLGATVTSIVTLLSKDFLKLVLIAMVLAIPLGWWALNKWLGTFKYHTDLSWTMFGLAGVLALGIALLTVSFQSVKAALMNPVKSLRSE